ncbi:hypothetical protein H6G33_04945 [Calothrix sp. FACHB-1219]|uniref:hypothetical protein n=1 Tax=unclassified Calothrix TaxID=2619626 RepID=UPI001684E8F1|nr:MULTISPECIES: hypothetical protein [unclassified Calothrix]MBD2203330.1 hypothetical protein [Calothrix sp. FACHB-168]MBD2216373.1 hypothetical protein [Calothrix sp. FACHB-1219]
MKLKSIPTAIALSLISIGISHIAYTQTPTAQQAQLNQEVAQLRPQGTSGLEKFLNNHASQLKNPSPEIRQALDKLCQQRDCYASQLYWYTDIEQAKTAAKASNKPILSLRLLGNLDQDLSCANSRFFRVALYPNAEISQFLRDRYILHWESVRPVPKVTVDFGDGRKLERTLTGNSIHYILDSSGVPIDAIPGLYGPQAFLRQLVAGEKAVKEYNKSQGIARYNFLRDYHRQQLASIQRQWLADLANLGIKNPPRLVEFASNSNEAPSASVAGTLAVTKMLVESPILRNINAANNNQKALREITDAATWEKIAQRYAADAKLDNNSVALIQSKRFQDSKSDNLQRVVSNFQAAMALDTVRNEYTLHSQIHQWFMQENATNNIKALNDKVYSELFLTPNTDPWLGLMSSESYSAIDNDGIRK